MIIYRIGPGIYLNILRLSMELRWKNGIMDIDHVYVIFRAEPRSEISKFINAYKSASSRLLKKEYPQIRENYGTHLGRLRRSPHFNL